jgi:hypothetical protein
LKGNITLSSDTYYSLLKENQDQEFSKEQLDIKAQSLTSGLKDLRAKVES